MVNCVSASAADQPIEAPLTQTISLRIAEAGFVVKINIFASMVEERGNNGFSPPGVFRYS